MAITVNKAVPGGTPSYTKITQSGKTLADANLTGSFTNPHDSSAVAGTLVWDSGDSTAVTANTTYSWTFTPTDTANYSTRTGSFTPYSVSTGGGGSTTPDPTPTTPSTTIPGNGGTDTQSGSKVDVPVAVDTSTGEVTVKLDDKTTETLITNALTKAADAGGDAKPVVTLDISGVTEAKTATFNVNTASAFSNAAVAVTIKLPDAKITLSPETLATLAAATNIATMLVTVEAAVVPMKDLQGMQAAQVKGYETVVNIDVFVGGSKVDVPVTVSLPYTLKSNENPAADLDDNGNLTKLSGVYDAKTGMITFTVSHQSYFVVGYDPVALWINVFSDVAEGAWYYDAVAYANYNGLFSGYGNGVFAPQGDMTRAMFVTVLWNLEGKPAPDGTASFSDVGDTWYSQAVLWAAENGIVNGVGGGEFAPDRAITRQEMAVMLLNYSDYKGYSIPANRDMPNFKDSGQIDLWAETAAKKLSEAGVISGDNNEFMPQKTATRAEVAQMFKNFLRFIAGDN